MSALAAVFNPIRGWFWLALAVLVVALDQATKLLATSFLDYASPIKVMPFLNWTLLYNKGAAFSFLSDAGGWQRWFFTSLAVVVSAVLVIWIFRLRGAQYLQKLSLAFILGGAVGNLWDRLVHGHVVDFIQVHYQQTYFFPAFNIADSAITLGAIFLVVDSLFNNQKPAVKEEA